MTHPALSDTAHRPWPLPSRPWMMTMDWQELIFLHWPIAPAVLQPHLPPGVEVDTFDGRAWLGVVPFRMARTRLRWLPPMPTAHAFPELNLRTYVRAGSRTGVWFFSLDAASRLAVVAARIGFGLPYFRARMRCERQAACVHYDSERADPRAPAARFRARWHRAGEFAKAVPGTLPHFLVERYCLFAQRSGRLVCGDIAHAPWQLADARIEFDACDVTRLLGCDLDGDPVSVLVAAPMTVAAFRPVVWA